MEKLIANKIWYNISWGMFHIETDARDYEGYMDYVDDKFILRYFSKPYIVEFKNKYVVKDWLKSIVEKYCFSTEDLLINYEELNKDLPFISLKILSVKGNEYIIKIKSTKEIFNYDINDYYIAHMYNDLRNIRLFYDIGDGKILKDIKEELSKKYKSLYEDTINF